MNATLAMVPARNDGLRNRPRSSTGLASRRLSSSSPYITAAPTGTAQAMLIQVQAGQPWLWPMVSGTSSRASAVATPTAPTGSRVVRWRDLGDGRMPGARRATSRQ